MELRTFYNLQEKEMTFEQVFERIKMYMAQQPIGHYKLMLGTDSQVHPQQTRFITGIVIQRLGQGVWACATKTIVKRKMNHLHERISFETSLTEEIATLFTENHKNELIHIILPHIYDGATFSIEGHIDIGAGQKNRTREFVREMTGRIESSGLEPKIKPDSFVASCYANRYTK
ncbi:ribonuclease H-like YkuK family protein [Alkalicoccobacillus plakortidis]|uniref:Ribonuclease H-like YkuK family protein n=1 Tax=Alkalicoccobacillus plakortidis TaxID=444060 RepID=A0ABT0XL02_9BACI|nr:ribonuclease H-like YkuK family protein [Alkalicoccobacillus plakortidis]MCM2676583.1 ribonuclease H-like YkuK family protein [Alkalicoccobacillus plakortidis]